MTGRRHERGLALVMVLWVIAALSLIAGAMLAASMTSTVIARNAWAQLETRNAADTAIQLAILRLFDTGTPQALDGSARRISVGDATVDLSIQDQSGLIDINSASPGLLKRLFAADGVETATAEALAGRIVDWRSPAGTSDFNRPDAAGLGDGAHRGRGGPLQSLDELLLVAGMSPEIYGQVAPTLTIYAHGGEFDMRVAPRRVLQVIPGMDASRADLTLAARTGAVPGPHRVYAIVAKAQRHQAGFSRRAVVLLTGDPARPYAILDWH